MDMTGLDEFLDGKTTEQVDNPDEVDTDGQETTPPEEQHEDEPPAQPPKQNKQEYAFAQMRAQNSQYKNMMAKLAQSMGIEFKDENELITKLNDDALGKLAEKQKVPVELLKRLEMLEQRDQVHEAQRRQDAAALGFQNVKKTYGLTDDELIKYAGELDADGKNPFVQDVDLLADYKLRHYDDIVQKRIDAAVQAALTKNSAADTHSTTPNNKGGKKDEGNPDKISTVAALDAFLSRK